MKKMALALSAVLMIFISSCADDTKDEGGNQVDEPVMNSGSNTEGERATDAVSDSASTGGDSVQRNSDAMSAPH